MHVLFINRFFYPDQSATAQMLTDLTEGLVVQGFAVTVVTGRVGYLGGDQSLPSADSYKGVRIQRVWSSRFGRGSLCGRLIDYLTFYVASAWTAARANGVSVVVAMSDPPMLSVLAVLVGRFKRWKVVCWLQDVFPEIAVQAGVLPDGAAARLLKRLARWSLLRSDRVIVVGRCMERYLLGFGISRQRFALIPNWADGETLVPVAAQDNWFRAKHKLDGRIVVMYSGNLGVVHEAQSLLLMIRHLRSVSEVCFLFVGEGQGKAKLEERVYEEGLENVRFMSYQAKEELGYSLSAGDIHLVTLRNNMEGLSVPSKIYGILAVGRPVVFIGPEGSEVAQLILEAGCGEVFATGDGERVAAAIAALARDRERRESMGAAGRMYFETHLDKRLAIEKFKVVLQD
jgi:glycosyltransferase involved in cell wall biosynthesis